MTEFGANKVERDARHVVSLADRFRVPWLYWDFCKCEDPTGADEGPLVLNPKLPPTGANVNEFALRTIVEPYPQLVAGTPRSWHYSRATGVFPAGSTADKYWPPVARIDQSWGDRNLVCSCPPIDSYQEAPEPGLVGS